MTGRIDEGMTGTGFHQLRGTGKLLFQNQDVDAVRSQPVEIRDIAGGGQCLAADQQNSGAGGKRGR